jgi:predicted RNA-binding protein
MEKIVKNKSILVGDEKLVKKKNWIPLDEMNTDVKILTHELFDTIFNKIVREHKPTHNIAFISLCTATRPYHLGRKWKKFVSEFSNKADLIVISSGGVIPQNYWCSFPYQNYDGDSAKSANGLYTEKLEKRLVKFFTVHNYDYVVANFRPKIRNTPVVKKVFDDLKVKGIIKDFVVVPDEAAYQELQNRGFPGGKMYPDLDELIFEKIKQSVDNYIDIL